jgi:hypothetical protein
MATDPVKHIEALEHESPLTLEFNRSLKWLAQLPPSTDIPYLTVCLGWRPEGSEPGRLPAAPVKRSERRSQDESSGTLRRSSWQETRRGLAELLQRHGPRGDAFESL